MSFDIYGNGLRAGFCEVHPQVAESYPCSFCLMEAEQVNQMRLENERYYREQENERYREWAESELRDSVESLQASMWI